MGTEYIQKRALAGDAQGEASHHNRRVGVGTPNQLKHVAVFVTLTAACMAAAAAWERGGTLIEKVLLVSMSAIIVLAVHLVRLLHPTTATTDVLGNAQ